MERQGRPARAPSEAPIDLEAPGIQALLAQAAPYREEGLRPPRRGGGSEGSYSTVRRVREAQARGSPPGSTPARRGFLLLDWLPGECQVDFGQADFECEA